jgi:hypothetical protein
MANQAAVAPWRPDQVSDLLGLLPREYWPRKKIYFAYTVNFLPLPAASQGTTQPITIDSDSDFALMLPNLEMTSTDDTTEFSYAPALINITTTLNNASIFNNPSHVMNFSPPGRDKYLFMPFIAGRGTVLNVLLQNLDLVNARNYRFTLHGFKIYNVLST